MGTIDPQLMHVLVRAQNSQRWDDKTRQVAGVRRDGARTLITYANGKEYAYGVDRVQIYYQVACNQIGELDKVYVKGELWPDVECVCVLASETDPNCLRYTLTRHNAKKELCFYQLGENTVQINWATPQQRYNVSVLNYIREEVRSQARRVGATFDENAKYPKWSGQGETIPAAVLATLWERLTQVPAGSALEAFISGVPSPQTGATDQLIMPFRANIDQRNAIHAALTHQISVIDGPPGTGKTQTILNLIATLVTQGKTVGVVAGANSAVDNMVDKLTEEGYGFLVANLGNTERVKEFQHHEGDLEQKRAAWGQNAVRGLPAFPVSIDDAALRAQEEQLVALWRDAREIPALQTLLNATQRERYLFEEKIRESRRLLPNISHLEIFYRDSGTIADLLALARCAPKPAFTPRGLVEPVRRYFAYGPLKRLDLGNVDVQSALQAAFYQARERELTQRINMAQGRAAAFGLEKVSAAYRQYSRAVFDTALLARFGKVPPSRLVAQVRLDQQTDSLLHTYPVVASTCFSIRNNLAQDKLLDWIIIDESSQVILPEGMAALSKARNAVIVGDVKQIGPIFNGWDESETNPPEERFDVRSLSLLDSVKKMPQGAVPSTLLKEHYRCHPAIIEFCNRMYYDGELIPMRQPGAGAPNPLCVVYAAPGNHERRTNSDSRFSQREIDIIASLEDMEVIHRGIGAQDKDASGDFVLGIVTPFRGQATELQKRVKAEQSEGNQARWLAETAHKFQGRGAGTVILSTVLNANDRSAANDFYDSDAMTNVIVSRAKDRLIVVTTYGGVRYSRNIRSLLDYIQMYYPSNVVESDIVSIFDVLYGAYAASLEKYSHAKWATERRSPAENVAEYCLRELLRDPAYKRLAYRNEVPLKDALPNVRRLNEAQCAFVYTNSALDFGVYDVVTEKLVLAIEVDGWHFHGYSDEQKKRDALKDSIMAAYGIPVLRLPTNGSGEEQLIRAALNSVLA
jgi:Superfamily I DNA and RNA helicases and helicase subunits